MLNDDESASTTIIFSMRKDAVWVSWPETNRSVRLGASQPVIYMMRDFLAQCDLGERLARRTAND